MAYGDSGRIEATSVKRQDRMNPAPARRGAGRILYWAVLMAILCTFATGRAAALDGDRMIDLTWQQCKLGPRVPGTPAHEAGRQWIMGQIKALGMNVREEPLTATLALSGQTVPACNLWGLPAADGPTSPALILSAHWDTRPWADHDPAGGQRPMDGANDGAAAVAAVLELARVLRATSLAPHVAIAFWDAEDAGLNNNNDSWALGAQYAAAHPPAWIGRVRLGINLDMVAGEDLQLYPETWSRQIAPTAVEDLWRIGTRMAPGIFRTDDERMVVDDHLPWVRRGTPFIDLVGINYRYWHTTRDNPQNCSARVLGAVTDVVYNYLMQGGWKK